MTKSYQHVYLSPHLDDASLSCGGAIWQQAQSGAAVLTITICTAPPEPHRPLSPFAQELHRRWGNPVDVVETRRTEDQASMNILGADFRHLDFNDAIYRGNPGQEKWYYTNNKELFGPIHRNEETLVEEITSAINRLIGQQNDFVIYAPLTVGNHVDHQLVHAAAWRLRQEGRTVHFYEDYPYTDPDYPFDRASTGDQPYSLKATLAAKQAFNLQPHFRPLSAEGLAAKIDSVRAYGSQLAMLFDGEAEMAHRVRNYALSIGQGQPAERIWLVS